MPFFLKLIELTDRAICEPSSFKRLTKSSLAMQLNDPFRHISKPSNSLAVLEEDILYQGTLITDGRNCNEMWILSTGLL